LKNTIFKQQFSFNDFDAFAEMINQANLEQSQIDIGNFQGSLTQVSQGPVIIGLHKMNRTILQEGAGIKGYTTFLITGNMEQDFSWRKNCLGGDRIGILKSGMEHSCITLPNFIGMPVSISDDYLVEISNVLGYPNFIKHINKSEVILIDKNKAKQIHRIIIFLCNSNNFDKSLLLFHLPRLIISSIEAGLKEDTIVNSTSRSIIFKRAQDYIFENIEHSINILDLCKEIGVSERNLRYVFKENIGISPCKFVRNVKLNKVRKLLKSSDQKQMVNSLANQLGFWHAGQFAKDYKNIFGELPSESLKIN
jgi:AraC family ethanolamine operon transcriptional activator